MKRLVSVFSVLTFVLSVLTVSLSSCTTNKSFANNKGKLPWPVDNGIIADEFGSKPHPDVPSVMIDNHGVDIRVEANTPVKAVFQGEVSGLFEVLGSTVVMIRHGEYVTVYQNLSSVNVKKGDEVKAQQVIGMAAKSLTNDNYELHFEVWKDSALNPNQWLKKYKKIAQMSENKPLVNTYWVLKSVKGEDIPKCIITPNIVFKSDGRYTGNLGCNSFFGTYNCGKKRIKMEFEGATKRLCDNMKVEKLFLLHLHSEFTQYEIIGDTLILKDKNGEVLRFFAGVKPE